MEMKKKIVSVYLGTLLMFLLTGCGCEHEFDNGKITKEPTCTEEGIKTFTCSLCEETKTESIPVKEHSYVESITKEATFEAEGEKTFKCKDCDYSYTEPIPVRDDDVIVTVTNKINIEKNIKKGMFSDRVEFVFDITNQTDKSIKGVQGVLKISDLFDKEILSMTCDFTGNSIAANDTVTVSDLGMDINEFMDTHVKLFNTDFSDLKFSYKITNIVYDDGTGMEEPTTSVQEEQKVVVTVKDKKNLEENWNAGRYSPRVEFTFDVLNNTEKEIKGVQGIFTIKDLFGVDIMSSTLDFTGQNIPVGESITVTDMGLDINEFMDEHVKLYTTDFSDLNFEYKVTSIVYADGTKE